MKASNFKMTELGPIPKDWEVKRLGEVCALCNGYAFKSSSYINNGKYTVITIANVQDGIFSIDAANAVTNLPRDIQRHQILEDGDILVSMTGNVGRTCRVSRKNCLLNQRVGKFDSIKIDRSFLYAVVQDKNFISAMVDKGQGGAQANISKHDIEEYLFPLPPLAEQRRIAEALSDIDELIFALGKLIEKKRNIKTGAMQELLGMRNEECGMRNVPRRRLAGFSGEWVEKRLGEVGDFIGGGTPSTAIQSYWNGVIDWYTPAEIGVTKYVNKSNRRISLEGLKNSAARLLPVGTILLTTRATIGLRAILRHEAATNQGFQSLVVAEEFDSEFMYYLLSTVVNEMMERASGSTFPEISAPKLKEISVMLPPTLAEQQAIAAVLSDMDAEIAALEAKRAKYESIKQGMMQELLTGKTRLKGERK